jgi:hypothetical protein
MKSIALIPFHFSSLWNCSLTPALSQVERVKMLLIRRMASSLSLALEGEG